MEDLRQKCAQLEQKLVESAQVGKSLLQRNSELERELLQANKALALEKKGNDEAVLGSSFCVGGMEEDDTVKDLQRKVQDLHARLRETENKLTEVTLQKDTLMEEVQDMQAREAADASNFSDEKMQLLMRLDKMEEELHERSAEVQESQDRRKIAAKKQVTFEVKEEDEEPGPLVFNLKSQAMRKRTSSVSSNADLSRVLEEEVERLTREFIIATDKIATLQADLKKVREERDIYMKDCSRKDQTIEELAYQVDELTELANGSRFNRKSMAGHSFTESFTQPFGEVGVDDEDDGPSFADEFKAFSGRRGGRGMGAESFSFMQGSQSSEEYSDEVSDDGTLPSVSSSFVAEQAGTQVPKVPAYSVSVEEPRDVSRQPSSSTTSPSAGAAPSAVAASSSGASFTPLQVQAQTSDRGERAQPLLGGRSSLTSVRGGESFVEKALRAPRTPLKPPEQQEMSAGSFARRQRASFRGRPTIRPVASEHSIRAPRRKPCYLNFYCCQAQILCGRQRARSASPHVPGSRRAAVRQGLRRALNKPTSRVTIVEERPAPDMLEYCSRDSIVVGGACEMTPTGTSIAPPASPRSGDAGKTKKPEAAEEGTKGKEGSKDESKSPSASADTAASTPPAQP
mmetsp:Transcript_43445/g.93073  ORF Transcript_43445/g.93073 Transcript_43445/m.93073 type:complete len:627 (+) Transcript_43445:161-2041(+)